VKRRGLTFAFAASLAVHLVIVPLASFLMAGPRLVSPERIDVTLFDLERPEKVEKREEAVKAKPKSPVREDKVTPPKLIEKKEVPKVEPPPPQAETIQPKPAETLPPAVEPPSPAAVTALPPPGPSAVLGPVRGPVTGPEKKKAEEPGKAGAVPGAAFSGGDVAVAPGPGTETGGGGGGDGTGGSTRPSPIHMVKPRYPEAARRAGVEGVTLLRIRVLENGRPGEIQIAKSSGSPDLDAAATEGARRWRFEPARKGKEAIPVWVLLPVRFELQ
jgi:protein TonB